MLATITAKSLQLIEQGGRESPSTTPSTAKSSRRDSLSEKVVLPSQVLPPPPVAAPHHQQQQPLPPIPQMQLPMKATNVIENAGTSVIMKDR